MSFSRSLKDLFFPCRCPGCGTPLAGSAPPRLCHSCRAALLPLSSPLCTCCGIPFAAGTDHLCGDCLNNRFAFDRARSLFFYQQPISTLLMDLKFRGRQSGLATLGALAAQARVDQMFSKADLVIPVPLHLERLRQRGFNQALLLARTCLPGPDNNIGVDLLQRHRATPPQIKLDGRARRRNLKGAFTVVWPEKIKGRTILLVDDVHTTGATLHECAKTLKKAGALRVEAFTLARAL